jgi:hypothetical protein
MGIRFRRSIKIAPGIRFNIGKKSASVRLGGRGAGFTMGTAGNRATVGVPGTGLSYTRKLGGKKQLSRAASPNQTQGQSQRLGLAGWIGVFAFFGAIVWVISAVL